MTAPTPPDPAREFAHRLLDRLSTVARTAEALQVPVHSLQAYLAGRRRPRSVLRALRAASGVRR